MKIRIATRTSKLALIQTEMVILSLQKNIPELECIIIPVVTTGDKITQKNLYDIGGKALFLKEIEEQLLDKKVDLAVHSLKDVPGVISHNFKIAAVLERADPRDCFVSFKCKSISDLEKGSIVGNSSVRRKVLISNNKPDLKLVQFRGNINTRLQKLRDKEVDATILACAGLYRTGLFNSEFCYPLEIDQMLPAAGQGTIAIEIRSNDIEMQQICSIINHKPTWYLAQAERSFIASLDASCRTPISAYAYYKNNKINATYMLSDIEGKNIRFINKTCSIEDANNIGCIAAKELSIMTS